MRTASACRDAPLPAAAESGKVVTGRAREAGDRMQSTAKPSHGSEDASPAISLRNDRLVAAAAGRALVNHPETAGHALKDDEGL
jgi:hypothetical protein